MNIPPIERRLTIMLRERLKGKEVGIHVQPSVMLAGMEVSVTVPGQHRVVLIQKKDLDLIDDPLVFDRIADEVGFAAFLLLDEDCEDA